MKVSKIKATGVMTVVSVPMDAAMRTFLQERATEEQAALATFLRQCLISVYPELENANMIARAASKKPEDDLVTKRKTVVQGRRQGKIAETKKVKASVLKAARHYFEV